MQVTNSILKKLTSFRTSDEVPVKKIASDLGVTVQKVSSVMAHAMRNPDTYRRMVNELGYRNENIPLWWARPGIDPEYSEVVREGKKCKRSSVKPEQTSELSPGSDRSHIGSRGDGGLEGPYVEKRENNEGILAYTL